MANLTLFLELSPPLVPLSILETDPALSAMDSGARLCTCGELRRAQESGEDPVIVCVGQGPPKPRLAYIPGAIYVDTAAIEVWVHDAKGQVDLRYGTGNLLPDAELRRMLEAHGLTADTRAHVYTVDFKHGSDPITATRLIWALCYAGVAEACLIDGGIAEWTALGFPVADTPRVPAPRDFFHGDRGRDRSSQDGQDDDDDDDNDGGSGGGEDRAAAGVFPGRPWLLASAEEVEAALPPPPPSPPPSPPSLAPPAAEEVAAAAGAKSGKSGSVPPPAATNAARRRQRRLRTRQQQQHQHQHRHQHRRAAIISDVRSWNEFTGVSHDYSYFDALGRIPGARWAHWGPSTYVGGDFLEGRIKPDEGEGGGGGGACGSGGGCGGEKGDRTGVRIAPSPPPLPAAVASRALAPAPTALAGATETSATTSSPQAPSCRIRPLEQIREIWAEWGISPALATTEQQQQQQQQQQQATAGPGSDKDLQSFAGGGDDAEMETDAETSSATTATDDSESGGGDDVDVHDAGARDGRVIFYCGSGWRSSFAWFLATLLGWHNAANYDGGWLEWSTCHPRAAELPKARGRPDEDPQP